MQNGHHTQRTLHMKNMERNRMKENIYSWSVHSERNQLTLEKVTKQDIRSSLLTISGQNGEKIGGKIIVALFYFG